MKQIYFLITNKCNTRKFNFYPFFPFFIFLFFQFFCHAQQKQANTLMAELYADAPYIVQKTDTSGQPKGIPILFICHDADGFGATVDLISISVQVKCMSSSVFGSPILLNNIPQQDFFANMKIWSVQNSNLGIQKFDTTAILQNNQVTFKFHDEMNWGIPPVYHEEINQRWWYFVYEFPPDLFAGLCDTIDFKITFAQDWATDDILYLRVIRSDEEIPVISGWYRGDTHFHSMFTQNTAEIGFPPDVSAYMAKEAGLNWLILTDHSCDYDNYGLSMINNWNEQGNIVSQFNQINQDVKLIRGIEMSVNNSNGQIVHSLVYPDPLSPYSLEYFSDGGGDISSTSVNLQMMSDSLIKYNAFCFAAHPFAQGDKLSFVVNGSVWNLSHPGFKTNGIPFEYCGEVICNDTTTPSDVYGLSGQSFFISKLVGVQSLNMRNKLEVSNELNNPWNPMHDNSAEFQIIDTLSQQHYLCRYAQNKEVYLFILQDALAHASNTGNYNNIRFFQIAGTDAHGSFNYSNTDYTLGLIGSVTDNALGKLSTLVYCPDGMGNDGENILEALMNGRAVMSDGPIITLSLKNNISQQQFKTGDIPVIGFQDISNWSIIYENATTPRYGQTQWIRFLIGTSDTIIYYYADHSLSAISLSSFIQSVFGNISTDKDLFIIAEMRTYRPSENHWNNNDPLGGFYHSYTNPIWIILRNNTQIGIPLSLQKFDIYPNPAYDHVSIRCSKPVVSVKVYDISGKQLFMKKIHGRNNFSIDISGILSGCYIIQVLNENGDVLTGKLVKY